MCEEFNDSDYEEVDNSSYEETDDSSYEETDDSTYEETDDSTYEETDDGSYEEMDDSSYEGTDYVPVEDESQMSPAELYERGQKEAEQAQAEAEQWADENGMKVWSDGTLRQNSEVKETEGTEVSEVSTAGGGGGWPSGDGGGDVLSNIETQPTDESIEISTERGMAHTQEYALPEQDEEDGTPNSQPEYGNAGSDPYASYPESHYSETSDLYMNEQEEMTAATNDRARRELEGFNRFQKEEQERDDEEHLKQEQEITDIEAWRDSNETKFNEQVDQSNETDENQNDESDNAETKPQSPSHWILRNGGYGR